MRPTHTLRPTLRPSAYRVSTAPPRAFAPPLGAARLRLFHRYRRLVLHVLLRHFHIFRGNPAVWAELRSAGREGLWRAAQRYSPGRRVKFKTYAYALIWGTCKHLMRHRDREADAERQFPRFGDNFIPGDGCVPDWSDPDPLALAIAAERHARVRNAMRFLDPGDAAIVAAHFGIGRPEQTLAEVAAALGLTVVRVRQRYRRALDRLITHYHKASAA